MMLKTLLTLLTALLLALPAQADIYKCRLANGKTEISNAPCPSGSGTITVRPDDVVPEQSRQQAERDVERMQSRIEKRQAAQLEEEMAERQRQAEAQQAAAQQRVYQSADMDECLRELAQHSVEAKRRAELEAICQAKARNQPTVVGVPIFTGGGPIGGSGHCIESVLRLNLSASEQSLRLAQCRGSHGQPQPPAAMPRPVPRPDARPGKPCPRGDLYCVR